LGVAVNKGLVRALRLVAITDNLRDGTDGLVGRTTAAVRGGATMVQVRLKDADPRLVAEVARLIILAVRVPVVVNDRVDVALAVGAAGVHLGIEDLPVAAVRTLVPTGFIIGASFGNADEAANAAGADYAGIGPVYASSSKPDAGAAIGLEGFAELERLTSLPCVGIGGIRAGNAAAVIGAGGCGVAAIASVCGAPDPEVAARSLLAAMATAGTTRA
jgi:thiamine-phosphate pyrophosphorylase